MDHTPISAPSVSSRERLLLWGGWAAIAFFAIQAARQQWAHSSDFDQVFMAGVAWIKGLSPYTGHLLPHFEVANGPTNAMLHTYYYAPLSGMLFAPLALLPFPVAVHVFKLATFSLLFIGVWQFLRLCCPAVPATHRWWLLGATALSGSVRWNLVQLQPTALIVAFLLLFAVAAIENRRVSSIFWGILISIKITYLLPVVGFYLFRRDIRSCYILGAAVVVLNLLSIIQTGPLDTISTYRNAVVTMEDPGKTTRPDALDFLIPLITSEPTSPFAPLIPHDRKPGEWAGEMIHFPFVLSSWGLGYKASKYVGLLLSLSLIGVYCVLWSRLHLVQLVSNSFQGLLFASLLATSLVIIYHQRYDAIALLPLSYIGVSALYRDPRDVMGWVVVCITFAFSYLLAARVLDWWYLRIVIPNGWLALVPICGYLSIAACLASIAMLWRETNKLASR
jgi:hypothetical protein